jgi:hypothetical protein
MVWASIPLSFARGVPWAITACLVCGNDAPKSAHHWKSGAGRERVPKLRFEFPPQLLILKQVKLTETAGLTVFSGGAPYDNRSINQGDP